MSVAGVRVVEFSTKYLLTPVWPAILRRCGEASEGLFKAVGQSNS